VDSFSSRALRLEGVQESSTSGMQPVEISPEPDVPTSKEDIQLGGKASKIAEEST
jgi:hypothetical protein